MSKGWFGSRWQISISISLALRTDILASGSVSEMLEYLIAKPTHWLKKQDEGWVGGLCIDYVGIMYRVCGSGREN